MAELLFCGHRSHQVSDTPYSITRRYRSADTGTLYNTNTLNALKIKYSTIGTQGIVATALSISVATNVTDPPGFDSDPDSKPNYMKF